MPPRSRATSFRPAADNSFASMPPVQPRSTSTTSTSLSFFAMVASAHVRNADGVGGERLVAELFDVLVVDSDDAGESEQLPACLVFVAAVHRVGEHAFHHHLIGLREKRARRRTVFKRHFSALQCQQKFLAF